MAALIRQSSRLLCRSVLYNSARAGSGEAKKPEDVYESVDRETRTNVEAFYAELKGSKTGIKELTGDDMKKQLGTLTGQHRAETLERLRGVVDPFDLGVHKQTNDNQGTMENPIIVPTTSGERLIGCVCEEDNTDVRWMNIYTGMKRQCGCGNWFQCVPIPGSVDH